MLTAIDVTSKKFEDELARKLKEKENLIAAKNKTVRSCNEKVSILRTKGHDLQDLIEKVRASGGGNSKDLAPILNKWEESNLRMFLQNPGDIAYEG